MTTVSPDAVALVKHFEGCKLTAYLCPAKVLTIGYGHTAGVQLGQTITQAEAEAFLAGDMGYAAGIVDHAVKVPLTPQQRSALVAFVFNVGAGKKGVKDGFCELKSGGPSTMLRRLNLADYDGAAAEFGKWVKADRKALPGLVARRAAEAALFQGKGLDEALAAAKSAA